MKKWMVLLLAACLLLGGCALPASVTTPTPTKKTVHTPASEPAEAVVDYVPYFSDPSLRGLRGDVTYRSDAIPTLGRLNNLYGGWAQGLYETITANPLTVRTQSAPNLQWIRMAFSSDAGKAEEVFTLYENNVVVTEHPTQGKRSCTAPSGTYATVLAYLEGIWQEQSRYFSLSPEHNDGDGYHQAEYTLYDASGKPVIHKETANRLATVELVGEGLVRVTDPEGIGVYEPYTGRRSVVSQGSADLCGDRLAVVDEQGVCVYPVFGDRPLCRVYVASTAANPTPVERVRFSEDGTRLHLILRNEAGTTYDRSVTVQEEIDSGVVRIVGEWRELLTPTTEKEEQTIAYDVLKKLRYLEQERGYMFSNMLQGRLQVEGIDYLLCELGHWVTDEDGAVDHYELLGYLMVTEGLYRGFVATVSDNELSWDTAADCFLK